MKYKIDLEIETSEELGDIDSLLEGSWLYDDMFPGAITKFSIKRLK